jgi:catechol 2,3-dioxygenase-like lactoylglutathione lyase family enzyme
MERTTSEPQTYALHHIHLICTDVDASERWFVDGVGAELVERRQSRGTATTELRLGGTRVLLRSARPDERLAPGEQRRYGPDHFGLQVADVDATVERLRARGVEIAREPDNSPTNRVAFITGPDNLLIELVQPR